MRSVSTTGDQMPSLAEARQAADKPSWQFVRTHGRLLAVAAGAVVFAWFVAAGVRWWTHPDLLGSQIGNGFSSLDPQSLARSQITFGITYPHGKGNTATMTFRSAPAMQFGTNTARATATFSVCYPRQGASGAIGAVHGTGSRFCSRLVPIVDGTKFEFPTAREYIVATVTPRTTGRVVLTGADFDYALDRGHWYRRGVDHVDMRVVLKQIY
jgi:hypothetical protein